MAGMIITCLLLAVLASLPASRAIAEPIAEKIEFVDQEFCELNDATQGLINNNYVAQSFIPSKSVLSSVDLQLMTYPENQNEINVTIYKAKPNGFPNLSNPLTGVIAFEFHSYGNYGPWYRFDFTDIPVIPGDTYFIRVEVVDNENPCNWVDAADGYANGTAWVFLTHEDYGFQVPNRDYFFRTYYSGTAFKPVADAGPDQHVTAGMPVTLSGAGSHDPDGTLTGYRWSIGDKIIHEGMEFQHVFRQPGIYIVSLTVTDSDGLTDTDTCTITVESPNQLPVPIIETGGFLGRYFNLPGDHPDVEGPITGIVTGDSPFNHDWYEEQYYSFTRLDPDLAFGNDFFPVDEGLPGDPHYFAVHWQATLRVPVSGVYPFEIGSDDDSWVYVDNQMVCDLGGIHALSITTHTAYLSAGEHRLDIYFAERKSVQSGFHFRFFDDNVTASVVLSDCPDIVRVAANLTIALNGAVSYDPDGMIVNQTWNFGDGTVGYGESVSHAYPGEGMYAITLAVRDDAGAETTTSVSIDVVSEPEPSGGPEPAAPANGAETAPEGKAEAAVQLIESGDAEVMTGKKGPGVIPFSLIFASLAVMAVALGRPGKMVRPRGRGRKTGRSLKEK